MPRSWGLRAATLAIGVLAPLAGAELLLRLHPSAYDGAWMLPVNREHPIARLQPDREFTWSHGWNFAIVNTVRSNNAGFVSDVDYRADAPGPLVAVVGDSFVEAFMVPYRQTCAGRLATMLEPVGHRVYSFGKGGAGLGQYLAYARYVRDEFRPQRLVVIVVRNDLVDSNRVYPGFHYFFDRGDGRLLLERVDFAPDLAHRLGRRSALVRYLAQNLKLSQSADRFRFWISGEPRPADERGDPAGTDRVTAASEPLIDAFLDRLPEYSGLGAERIVLVVDGMRPELYDDELPDGARGNLADATRRRFLADAARRGYRTIDMQPRFRAHHRKHRRRFEWPRDRHWNALGHERCFEAVRSSKLLADVSPVP